MNNAHVIGVVRLKFRNARVYDKNRVEKFECFEPGFDCRNL